MRSICKTPLSVAFSGSHSGQCICKYPEYIIKTSGIFYSALESVARIGKGLAEIICQLESLYSEDLLKKKRKKLLLLNAYP